MPIKNSNNIVDGEFWIRSPRLRALLLEYGESHQNLFNRQIHKFCVPAIMFSLLGLLRAFGVSWLFIVFVLGYYATFKDWRALVLGAGMIFPMAISLEVLKRWLFNLNTGLLSPCLIIFAVAWIGQFWGHKVEGKKPSFFKDIFFLLIGPLWVAEELIPAKLRSFRR